MKILIKNINEFRTLIAKAGHTLSSFSVEISTSKSYMSLMASGNRYVNPKIAKKICEILNKEFDDIFFTRVSSNGNSKKSA